MLGLATSIALEYAKFGVRANAICRAPVHTDSFDRFTGKDPAKEAYIESLVPQGRSGTPDEVAPAVWWLFTEGTWTTGQAMVVDGGFTVG